MSERTLELPEYLKLPEDPETTGGPETTRVPETTGGPWKYQRTLEIRENWQVCPLISALLANIARCVLLYRLYTISGAICNQ